MLLERREEEVLEVRKIEPVAEQDRTLGLQFRNDLADIEGLDRPRMALLS